ncbi:MAG: nucleotidyltransferase domain-containing protein [Methanosarcina sp.]|nr:nucleotidyltransferase domain-containing protein [Methanosarcina sp.]
MVQLVFSSLVGSRACGYHKKKSDYDVMVIYAEELNNLLGLEPVKDARQEIIGNADIQEIEIKKFLSLILDNNPRMLETLFSPIQYKHDNRYWSELNSIGVNCITQDLRKPYLGIIRDYMRKIENQEKDPMKLIYSLHRNLLTCMIALSDGEIILDMRTLKDLTGHSVSAMDWYEVAEEMIAEIEEMDSDIPEHIDQNTHTMANSLLLKIRSDCYVR